MFRACVYHHDGHPRRLLRMCIRHLVQPSRHTVRVPYRLNLQQRVFMSLRISWRVFVILTDPRCYLNDVIKVSAACLKKFNNHTPHVCYMDHFQQRSFICSNQFLNSLQAMTFELFYYLRIAISKVIKRPENMHLGPYNPYRVYK